MEIPKIELQNKQLDKTTLLIMCYFIERLNGVLGKTHLQKLIFLTDLLGSKKFGTPISKMNYIKYNHGPYDLEFGKYIEKLTEKGVIEERKYPWITNPDKSYSRFYIKNIIDVKKSLLKILDPEKMLLIDEISQSYGNKSLQEVLDFVYSLEVVNATEFDSPIKIAQSQASKSNTTDEADSEDIDDILF